MEAKQMFEKKSDSGYLEPVKGVQLKTLVHGEKTHLCKFKLQKGSVLTAHSHPHEQTGYLVSGSLKFRIGDEAFDAAEGDSWNIPGGDGARSGSLRKFCNSRSFFPFARRISLRAISY